MIVIPAIDIMNGNVVRLCKGDPKNPTIYGSDPLEFAKHWEEKGADMLHIVDLDATLGLGANSKIIDTIATNSKIKVEYAGGLRSIESATRAAGKNNKIIVGTMALTDTDSLYSIRDLLGKSRVIVSLDHHDGNLVTHGWTSRTNKRLLDTLDSLIKGGISEFMITDVNRDGMMAGPETFFMAQACSRQANIIASGGITNINDIIKIKECGAQGVILGRCIYDKRLELADALEVAHC